MPEQDLEPQGPGIEPLMAREREILTLMASGWSRRHIAEELILSSATVARHLRRIYLRLGARNRDEALAQAQAIGLVAPSPPLPATHSNLPTPATPFIGRHAELQIINQHLLEPAVRLVVVLGPGGIGKTRLALAAASRQLQRHGPAGDRLLFPDGVWHVSLAPLHSRSQVITGLAGALRLPPHPNRSERTLEMELLDFLRQSRLLLVLDNFEHLPGAVPLLADLLHAGPQLKVLATSRQRLHLPGEHLISLRGLQLPPRETGTIALRSPAVRLFTATARRVAPSFTVEEADVTAVVRTCRAVEGLPLAIELAASWIRLLSPPEIEREVRRGLEILAGTLQDVPPRHRSIQATLDLSWQQLSPAEKDVFRRLSIFRNGFTRAAALQVTPASPSLLAALRNASWLTYSAARDRYQLHELLRQFGESRLAEEADAEQDARYRHARYFMTYLHQHEADWYGDRQQELFQTIHPESDNIRLAWTWAATHREVPLLSAGLHSLCLYLERRGDEGDAQELLQAASDRLFTFEETDDIIAGRRLLIRLLAWRARFTPSTAAARLLLDQAARMLADLLPTASDLRPEEALLSLRRGMIEMSVDLATSRPYLEHALSLAQELPDPAGEALATTALARVERHLGNYGTAAALVRRALHTHEALGDRRGIADGLDVLGLLEKHRGRLPEARHAHRQSLALWRELGDRSGLATTAADLASTLCWSGDFAEARTAALEGLRIAEELGSASTTSYVSPKAAEACIHLGLYHEARHYAEQAITLARETGERQVLGWALTFLGLVDLVSAAVEEAVDRFHEAATVLGEHRNPFWMVPSIFAVFALRQLGRTSSARKTLVRALQAHLARRVFLVAVTAVPAAAQLTADAGDLAQALELAALAYRYPHVANSRWFERFLGPDVEAWSATLPAEAVDDAALRGRERDLGRTVEELIVKFGEE